MRFRTNPTARRAFNKQQNQIKTWKASGVFRFSVLNSSSDELCLNAVNPLNPVYPPLRKHSICASTEGMLRTVTCYILFIVLNFRTAQAPRQVFRAVTYTTKAVLAKGGVVLF